MSKTPPSTAIGAAFGTALVVALAQLGLASGLAILLWQDGNSTEWASQLSWAAWLAAASTVVGSLVAGQLNSEVGTRITSTLAAGVGAFAVAPLVAVPAMRYTGDAIATAPFAATGIGVLAGMAVAGLALVWRAIWVNVASCIGLVWALAIMAALIPLSDNTSTVELGVWGEWFRPWAAPPLWAGTLVIGMITAWALANGSMSNNRASAISGAVSPLLVSVAYAASWQPDIGVRPNLMELGIGGGAALSGLLGSLLVTAWRKPATAPVAPAATETVAETPAAQPTVAIAAAAGHDSVSETTRQVAAAPTEPLNPYAADVYDPYDEGALGEFAEPRPSDPAPEPVMPPAPEVPSEAEPAGSVAVDTAAETKSTPTADSSVGRDDTESWVSDLRDDTTAGFPQSDVPATEDSAEPKKKKRWGKGKKKKD